VRRAAAVAVAAALVVLGAVLLLDTDHRRSVELRATGTAVAVGLAELSRGSAGDQLTMTIAPGAVAGAYRCEVVLTDGTVVDLGEFGEPGEPDGPADHDRWSGSLPAPIDAVRTVRVADEEGRVLATGEVTG
jgi:hypothetical protein